MAYSGHLPFYQQILGVFERLLVGGFDVGERNVHGYSLASLSINGLDYDREAKLFTILYCLFQRLDETVFWHRQGSLAEYMGC